MSLDKGSRIALFEMLGLSSKEAEIYDLLITQGELSARKIEVISGYKKNTYQLLKQLLQKHLVLKKVKDSHVYYVPARPERLQELSRETLRQAKEKASQLIANLSELRRIYEVSAKQPVLQYVEGANDLRELYLELYKGLKSETYGCLDLVRMKRAIPELMDEELIPKRNERKSKAYALLADNEEGRSTARRDREEQRESILLDSDKYPLPAEISVYEDKVVLLSFRSGKATGFVIRDPDMVTSLRSIYQYLFDRCK